MVRKVHPAGSAQMGPPVLDRDLVFELVHRRLRGLKVGVVPQAALRVPGGDLATHPKALVRRQAIGIEKALARDQVVEGHLPIFLGNADELVVHAHGLTAPQSRCRPERG